MKAKKNTSPGSPALNDWLRDYNEAPWRHYIGGLKARGMLLEIDGVMVDCQAMLETRFQCDTRTCASIGRSSDTESCCTDYDVEITPAEKQRIVANADAILELLAQRDPERVTRDRSIEEFFEESHMIELAKERGRCAFSYRDPAGQLRCGLHSLALERGVAIAEIKPLTCVFFPVVVYRFENGDTLLTAISRDTADLMEGGNDTQLPCLKAQRGDPMFMECRTAIETGFGAAFYEQLSSAYKERMRSATGGTK